MLVETGYENPTLSVLFVSPEYPPVAGGVGRYTSNLRDKLVEMGFTVQVVCDKRGNGDFSGISQHNPKNSEILLELVERLTPDVVHVQYEPGLYELRLDMLNPARTRTNIDAFYESCKTPIVTTFHSGYPFRQWMSLPIPIYERQNDTYIVRKAKRLVSFWTRLINYRSFQAEAHQECRWNHILRIHVPDIGKSRMQCDISWCQKTRFYGRSDQS
jgi:glycosyltransferase involved in cell wall biosynthesis